MGCLILLIVGILPNDLTLEDNVLLIENNKTYNDEGRLVYNKWVRPCRFCGGTGKEECYPCSCPFSNSMAKIDHPSNNVKHGLAKILYRCDNCKNVWLVYEDYSDDSVDIPRPLFLGRNIPDVNLTMDEIEKLGKVYK